MTKELANKNYKKELNVLDDYIRQVSLPKKLLLGRIIPDVPLSSPIMVEWAEEQYDRVLNGITIKGHYYNPFFYHFLNFFLFEVIELDKNRKPTGNTISSFPLYSNVDEYIFDKFWDAAISGLHVALMTGRGQGKFQKNSTLTPTPNGDVQFGDLKKGDNVYTKSGKITKVKNIKEYGKLDTFILKTNDGRETNCSTGHLWEVYDIQDKKLNKEETKVVEALFISNKLIYGKGKLRYRFALPIAGEVYYKEKKLIIDPYVMGYLLGNGAFNENGIRVSTIDSFIVNEFEKILGDNFKLVRDFTTVNYYIKELNKGLKIDKRGVLNHVNSFTEKTRQLGLEHSRAFNKKILDEYKYSSIEQRYSLVQGLMDSDGSASKNGSAEYYSVSEQLIDDLAFVLRSLGIKCLKGNDIRDDERRGFRLYIYTGKPIFRLPRKKKLLLSDEKASDRVKRFRYRTSIVGMKLEKGNENGRCIEVDDASGTYLTNNFLVTHNSFIGTSIVNRRYNFFPKSHCVISASISDHVDTAWKKVQETLRLFNERYPMFAHGTIKNDDDEILSGFKKKTDIGEIKTGYLCNIEKVLYGKNANKTRSMRPNIQLLEEFGAFASKGPASLKNVLNQSAGSHRIGGGLVKTFMMLMGTGGSVDNDDAKDVFLHPNAYNIYPIYEWNDNGSGLFFPMSYKYTKTWEKTGTPDIKEGERLELKERAILKKSGDAIAYQNHCQEFPLNLTEVFLKKGTNLFNQDRIANQWIVLENNPPKIKKGYLDYIQNNEGVIIGVEFKENGIGPINIVEEVELDDDGRNYQNLYVMGVDSIDQGGNDSVTSDSKSSKLVGLVKKRIIDGKYQTSTHNVYVAWYEKRSPEVRDDYENILKLAIYYGALVNLEYTKIGIVAYFRERNFKDLFMKRPTIASPSDSDSRSKLIGTPASMPIILHQDEKIRDYINDWSDQIMIIPLLAQLRDYQQEDRTKYDFVVAMGMCELADEDLLGKLAKIKPKPLTHGMSIYGYYTDDKKRKRYGIIPSKGDVPGFKKKKDRGPVRWIDTSNNPRYDEEYEKEIKDLF